MTIWKTPSWEHVHALGALGARAVVGGDGDRPARRLRLDVRREYRRRRPLLDLAGEGTLACLDRRRPLGVVPRAHEADHPKDQRGGRDERAYDRQDQLGLLEHGHGPSCRSRRAVTTIEQQSLLIFVRLPRCVEPRSCRSRSGRFGGSRSSGSQREEVRARCQDLVRKTPHRGLGCASTHTSTVGHLVRIVIRMQCPGPRHRTSVGAQRLHARRFVGGHHELSFTRPSRRLGAGRAHGSRCRAPEVPGRR